MKTWLRFWLCSVLLYSTSLPAPAQSRGNGGPRPIVLYTDIVSGPNSGGENDQGIYLSLFGRHFGSGKPGAALKVLIGGVEVANYRSLAPSRARADIMQLTVQIGALGKPRAGLPLPIKIVVNGNASNDDLTFTVNPGNIFFVDNVKGNDRSAIAGDIHHPFRHVQTARLSEGAWSMVQPGDFIVLRGTGTAWTDRGYRNYFLRTANKSGTKPIGVTATGPIGLMGYPGEDVFIDAAYDAELEQSGATGAISAENGLVSPGMGQWFSISNLRIEGGGHDGAVNLQIKGNHWRVVNNDLSAASAINNAAAKAGGIAGNGAGQVWLGNRIHDIYCGPEHTGPLQNHGIYIDGAGDYEIAYNVMKNIAGGSGFQIYVNGSNGSATAGNVRFHGNVIDKVGKHGINLADGARERITLFDNIVANTYYAGLRFNTVDLIGAKIHDNTFYNTNTSRKPKYGALMNDWNLLPAALDLQANLFVPHPGTDYAGGSVGFSRSSGTIRRNFWSGAHAMPSFDADPQTGKKADIEVKVFDVPR